jgi:hypothetical protein
MALKQTNMRFRRIVSVLLAGWLGAAGGNGAAQEHNVPLVLTHRFAIEEPPSWGHVTVNLSQGQWRVGGPDGPVASAWQLKTALGALVAIEVGGCCSAWVDGPTAYPCGFTLRGLELPGLHVDSEPASASPDAGSMLDGAGTGAFACAGQDSQTREGPMRRGAMRFISIRPWLHNPGDHARALGSALRFQFRGVANDLHPSKIDRASGVVILRAVKRARAS